ncbi:MAG: sialidase family protein [bacterium]
MQVLTLALTVFIAQSQNVVDLTQAPGVRTAIVVHGQGYFPVLDRTPDGELVVVLRGGGGHLGIGGRLDLLFSRDGLTWYGMRTAVDTAADDRNPAFGITPSGRFLLGIHHQAGYNGHGIYQPDFHLSRDIQLNSDDKGVTWSGFQPLKYEGLESTSPYGRIIRLKDGTYLQNVYGAYAPKVPNIPPPEEGIRDYSYVIRSTDEGQTWGDPSFIASNHNETALLEIKDGAILAAARSEKPQATLDLYRSTDDGRTWEYVSAATSRNGEHPADLIDLGNGTILMIYGNRHDEDEDIRGILSRDNGKTWDTETVLSLTEPVTRDFGYPSGVVLGDNLVIVHYSAGKAASSYDGSHAQCRATRIPIKAILNATR